MNGPATRVRLLPLTIPPPVGRAWETVLVRGSLPVSEALEAEAHRGGVKTPVYQGGQLVGYVEKYSDTLLLKLLMAWMPDKYADEQNQKIDVSGSMVVEYVNDWRRPQTIERRQYLQASLEQARSESKPEATAWASTVASIAAAGHHLLS